MKRIVLLFIPFFFISCFQKKHKIETLEFYGDIYICLEESIGYQSYSLEFNFSLSDGEKITTYAKIYPTNVDQKCFLIEKNLYFKRRHTPKSDLEIINRIWPGNIDEMIVTIYDGDTQELISKQIFHNL